MWLQTYDSIWLITLLCLIYILASEKEEPKKGKGGNVYWRTICNLCTQNINPDYLKVPNLKVQYYVLKNINIYVFNDKTVAHSATSVNCFIKQFR